MTLTTPAPSAAPAPTTLPAVVCAPWCREGGGHTDVRFPEEQVCTSETVDLGLTRLPLVEIDDDTWERDSMHLYLLRHAGGLTTTVEMYRGDLGESTSLTVDEAQALGEALLHAAGQARGRRLLP